MFPKTTYQERRQKLMEEIPSGIIILLGNNESPINFKDNAYPFRQDSTFLYYFGIDRPDLIGLIDIDEQEVIVFGDEFTLNHLVWMGPQPTIADEAERAGITDTRPLRNLASKLSQTVHHDRTIHYLPPYRAANLIQLHKWLDIPMDQVPQNTSEALIKAVVKQASIKTEEEVAELEKAVNLSGALHVEVMKTAIAGMKERELVGRIEGLAIKKGGRLGYPAILTVNGQTLHNHYYGNTLEAGQLLLGDFGAETALHYTGDITRTFPVNSTFSVAQRDIYTLVLNMLESSIKALKPGVTYREIHLGAAKILTDGLKDLGLMKGNTEDAIAQGAHALFFPHGLGHMLGLDVHDMEDLGEDFVGYDDQIQRSNQFGLSALRLGKTLQAGFVITVEPGCYFIPELIDRWQEENKLADFIVYENLSDYRNFGGIRIEDNILITKGGHRVLGDPIPKSVKEIEAIRSEACS